MIFVEKLEGQKSHGRLMHRRDSHMKMYLQQAGWGYGLN
jgi:hypothetical protein